MSLYSTRQALAIWHEATDPVLSPVESYLARRGLELPDAADEVLRYHGNCLSGPAMVALVRDIRTNEPRAVHRTLITASGEKRHIIVNGKPVCRLSLGPTAGGAVKITPDEHVTLCLGIGEGVESTLSMRDVPEFGGSPVWALLSANGIRAFPVLPGVESLWIGVDRDANGVGERAAEACEERWCAAEGREVFRMVPRDVGVDLNDLLSEESGDAA